MKGRNIVVTGGAGFIGSNLTRALFKENQVVVVDDFSTGRFENIEDIVRSQGITLIKNSVSDLNTLQEAFKDVDYVFHEAAIPSVPRSLKDPISSNFANVNGTLNVLVAARDNNVEKVVYASSSSVYGNSPTLPKVEDMKPLPLSPYAVSKLTGEYYCQVFTEVYNLKTVSLRYFNVYGPHQDPYSEYAAVIPKFISKILKDESPNIYGDGEQTRDFSYIKDVVNANILAAENKATDVFNIASGNRISINDLAKLIMKILQKDIEPTYVVPQPGDIKHSLADVNKAKEKFGYIPMFNIEKGLMETIEWFQK